jgi:hypothetical protein
MLCQSRRGILLLAVFALLALSAGQAAAQYGCYTPAPAVSYYAPAPAVSYYAPAPAVSYYAAPAVSYYAPAPAVSYYAAPAVSYYAAPAVSYYSGPAAVSTYRYGGLFGRRVRVSNYYYPGGYYYP